MQNMFIAIGVAFLFQLYVIWLVLEECDRRFKTATSPHKECDKFFELMINDLGMSYRETEEEYNKIETYSALIRINKSMEKHLRKQKTEEVYV